MSNGISADQVKYQVNYQMKYQVKYHVKYQVKILSKNSYLSQQNIKLSIR